MKKLITAVALATLLTGTAMAENIQFDPNTKEGRAMAYAALNQSNALGNAQRLERNLTSLSKAPNGDPKVKALAEKLIPQLKDLQAALQ